jgi:transposase
MDDSAPDGSKRSVNDRIDIRVGVERRRRWGREDKLRIVRESLAPNVVVTEVARRHEISTGLLYTWRKQALAGLLGGFVPVRIVANAEASTLSAIEEAQDRAGEEAKPTVGRSRCLIEVVWPNGIMVRVDADVDERALRSVVAALEAR